LLLLALFASSAAADVPLIRSITLTGNRTLSASTFTLKLKAGQPFSESLLEADRASIISKYAEYGFLRAAVEAETTWKLSRRLTPTNADSLSPRLHRRQSAFIGGPTIDLRLKITEGERAQIGRIQLTGNHMVATRVLAEQLPVKKGFFTAAGLKADVQTLVSFYGDNGFPFCQVRPESLSLNWPRISWVLAIDEGPDVRLSDVRFTGKLETRPAILKRMLGLGLDAPYSETRVRQCLSHLAADPLLTINGFDIRQTAESYWLEVKAQEQKSNRVSGAIAYSAVDHEVDGAFDLNLDNLFGTRRAVDLDWQKSPGEQILAFDYTEPWVLNSPISLTAAAHNRTLDTNFSATELSLAGQIAVTEALQIQLLTDYEFVAAAESSLPSSSTWWGGSALDYDTRDQRANPSRGVLITLDTRAGARQIATRTSPMLRSELDIATVLPIIQQWSFSVAAHGRDLEVRDTVYQYDMFELGGANSLRGYNEDQFLTPRCAWFNTELRCRVGRMARIYPFYDLAFIQGFGWRAGYGAGIRIQSGIGLLGIDYGIAAGANPLQGKVHLSLQTSF
jgi:outer membrane protein assembly factor BamA